MRTLEFDVKDQRLLKSRNCSFTGIVAGSVGYLKAKFNFSSEWNKCTVKIAKFRTEEREVSEQLDYRNSCSIPDIVLKGDWFEVSVAGACPGFKIETNENKVKQEVR